MSEEVDLIVVHDHKLAERILKALKHAGIHHVEFWPEHMLGVRYMEGGYRTGNDLGPFRIQVREEDLAQAQLVLSSSGLT